MQDIMDVIYVFNFLLKLLKLLVFSCVVAFQEQRGHYIKGPNTCNTRRFPRARFPTFFSMYDASFLRTNGCSAPRALSKLHAKNSKTFSLASVCIDTVLWFQSSGDS